MTDIPSFTSFAPGFEFLQGLVKNAGSAIPGIGQWVAPTLNPEELDKRIQELRTIQFWLEQNARMLGATIQALEVQKMTLATLQTMNVQMSDLRDSLTIRMPGMAAARGAPRRRRALPMRGRLQSLRHRRTKSRPPRRQPRPAVMRRPRPTAGTPKPAVDPMQWWGALTQQFSELAANALKEGAAGLAAAPATTPAPAAGKSRPKATAPAQPRKAAAKTSGGRKASTASRKTIPRSGR
jgi:hypothetical protein